MTRPSESGARRLLCAVGILAVLGAGCVPDAPAPGEPDPPEPACPEGEIEDGEECVPEACGVGPWGDDPAPDAIHVAANGDGDGDGDGSAERPFSSVQQALDAVESGGLVQLGAGVFPGSLRLDSSRHGGVTLRGRCAAMTTIQGDDEADTNAINVREEDVTIEGLTVSGGYFGVALMDPIGPSGGSATLRGVTLTDWREVGLAAFSGSLEVDGIKVIGPGEPERIAIGVHVADGARATGAGLEVAGAGGRGVQIKDGGSAVLDRVTVTDLTAAGTHPGAVVVEDNEATLTSLVVERADGHGLIVALDASVELRGALFRDIAWRGATTNSVWVTEGAELLAEDVTIEGGPIGVRVNYGGMASVTRLRITDPTASPDGEGAGFVVGDGYALLSDSTIEGAPRFGAFVTQGGTLELVDVEIRDIVGATDEGGAALSGFGLAASAGTLVASGVRVVDSATAGMLALESATVQLDNVDIVGEADGSGRGVELATGANLTAEDLSIEGVHEIGVFAWGDGTLFEGTRVTVRGTRQAATMGSGGALHVGVRGRVSLVDSEIVDNVGPGALVFQPGSAVELSNTELRGNGFAGVVALDGAAATLHQVTITETGPHPGSGGGIGLLVDGRNRAPIVRLADTEVRNNPVGGVHLVGPSSTVIDDSVFSDNGAPVYLPGGVFAADGVGAWTGSVDDADPDGEGLLLRGNSFGGLDADAVVLDGSSASLASSPTGAPNDFSGLSGEPLFWQTCAVSEVPDVLDGSDASTECRGSARPIGPLLEYRFTIGETSAE